MATPMTLEGCAELRAEMEAGQLRDEVLARAALSVEAWTAAQTEWLDRMGAEMERGRFELTNRYSHAFLERQRALHASTVKVIEAPTAPMPPLHAAPVAAPSPAVVAELPSFLLPASPSLPEPVAAPLPMPAPVPQRPPSALSGSSMRVVAPKGAELPFARAEAAPPSAGPPPVPPRPQVNRAPAALSGTSTGFIAPKEPALPFAKAPPTPVVVTDETQPMAPGIRTLLAAIPGAPFVPGSATAGRLPSLDVTTMGASSPFAPVLPFGSSPAAASPPRATSPPPAPAPARAPERDLMDMTTMGAVSPFARVLPFGPPAAPTPPLAPTPPRATPAPTAPAAGPLLVGGLTLEQHVSLCAEIAFNPAQLGEILSRYRITTEGKVELDRLWKERFAADPALEGRWREAHGMYLTFLRRRRT